MFHVNAQGVDERMINVHSFGEVLLNVLRCQLTY